MAFTTVKTNVKYYKYSECKAGDVLVNSGTYKGTSEGKFGTQHHFIQDDGQAVTLNKAGQLDWLLDNYAKVGIKVNVIFDGTKILEKGTFKGKPVNNFILQVDDQSHSDIPESKPAADFGGADISL